MCNESRLTLKTAHVRCNHLQVDNRLREAFVENWVKRYLSRKASLDPRLLDHLGIQRIEVADKSDTRVLMCVPKVF